MACSEMSQRYNHIAGGNGISLHYLLFNLALTHPGATGAYLRHAVVGAISNPLHNCVSAGLRSGTPLRGFPPGAASALRLCKQSTSPPITRRSIRTPALRAEHHTAHHRAQPPHTGSASRAPHRPPPGAASATMETMTGGGHFCYPVRGCSRA